mmetsp:Transcript_19430/g.42451  ORF Transcript_19430/g.42451 Transcript_19430/m.42451 type:complete len:327 (+) Transcript_19430:162-1142(+)
MPPLKMVMRQSRPTVCTMRTRWRASTSAWARTLIPDHPLTSTGKSRSWVRSSRWRARPKWELDQRTLFGAALSIQDSGGALLDMDLASRRGWTARATRANGGRTRLRGKDASRIATATPTWGNGEAMWRMASACTCGRRAPPCTRALGTTISSRAMALRPAATALGTREVSSAAERWAMASTSGLTAPSSEAAGRPTQSAERECTSAAMGVASKADGKTLRCTASASTSGRTAVSIAASTSTTARTALAYLSGRMDECILVSGPTASSMAEGFSLSRATLCTASGTLANASLAEGRHHLFLVVSAVAPDSPSSAQTSLTLSPLGLA